MTLTGSEKYRFIPHSVLYSNVAVECISYLQLKLPYSSNYTLFSRREGVSIFSLLTLQLSTYCILSTMQKPSTVMSLPSIGIEAVD